MTVKANFHIGHDDYKSLISTLSSRAGFTIETCSWSSEDKMATLFFDRLIDVPCAIRPYLVKYMRGDYHDKNDVFIELEELIMKNATKVKQ